MGSESQDTQVDGYMCVDSDIEVVPQTDSENEERGERESDEPEEDREVNVAKCSTDEVEAPSLDITNNELCSRKS